MTKKQKARSDAQAAYKRAVDQASIVYERAIAPSWEVYEEAMGQARKAYTEVMAEAWKIYEEATASDRRGYKRAIAEAWEVYTKAMASRHLRGVGRNEMMEYNKPPKDTKKTFVEPGHCPRCGDVKVKLFADKFSNLLRRDCLSCGKPILK